MAALETRAGRQLGISALGVTMIVLLVYAQTQAFEFVWDDSVLLWNSSYYRGDNVLEAIWSHFPVSENYFRPLVVATFVTDMVLFNNRPGPMHLHNVIFHAGNAVLVGALTAQILMRFNALERAAFPLLAALAFGLSPMLVEPVAWVSGRFDIYVTFWLLLLINLDLKIQQLRWRMVLAYVLFLMAALSKEMAATFPLVYILLRMMLLSDQGAISSRIKALKTHGDFHVFFMMVASGLTYLALRFSVLGYLNQGAPDELLSQHFGSFIQHCLLVGKTAGTYLLYVFAGGAFTSPVHYQEFPISYNDYGAWFGLFIFVCCMLVSVLMIIRGFRSGFLLPIFFIALFPVLNFVFWPNTQDLVQERFLSFPLALFLALSMAIIGERFANNSKTKRKERMVFLVLCAWIGVNGIITLTCVPIWKNHLSLWSWAAYRSPQSAYANVNLSSAYRQIGDLANAKKHAEIANQLNPESGLGNLNLAAIAVTEKDYQTALRIIEKDIESQNAEFKKEESDFMYMKAMALNALGKSSESASILENLLKKNIKDGNSAMLLGVILQAQGEIQRANACWVIAVRAMPTSEAGKLFSDGVVHEEMLLSAAQGRKCLE